MRTIKAECVQREEAVVGESPVWCSRERVLYWVDITGRKIHRFWPATRKSDAFDLPHPVTALAVRSRGGLVLLLRKKFAFFDLATRQLSYLDDPEADKPENRFNDAKCDREGRFWAGTMGDVHWDAPCGALYRLDPDGTITCHQTDVICANGMGWSPDNRTMYFTESFRYAIFAYDFDSAGGKLSNRRVFASLDAKGPGFPDGLTVDTEGHVWSVHNAVGRVVRYTPAGEIERVVELPVPRPCGCAFGGENLDTLYITTARETLTPAQIAQYPLSGSLFAADIGVCGLPEAEFAG